MHRFDERTEAIARAIIDYALERVRLDPPPLDGTRTPRELRAAAGHTITPAGIGGSEALRVFAEVLAPATISVDHPRFLAFVPAAPTVAEMVKGRVAGWGHRAHVLEGEDAKLDAMKAATVALACSGTVTTELALAGVPMVVGYRLGPMTYAVVRRLIRTPYITLFNIAAQAFVAPELVQKDCNGPALAREVAARLDDPSLRARQVAAQNAGHQARDWGVRTVDVLVRGPGAGRESAIRALQTTGIDVKSIRDVTPIPHNGCRPRKRRRV